MGYVAIYDANGAGKDIYAHVPLAQMFGYATTLRSMSQGRAVYVMEPDGFQDVPKSIQEEIVKARAK